MRDESTLHVAINRLHVNLQERFEFLRREHLRHHSRANLTRCGPSLHGPPLAESFRLIWVQAVPGYLPLSGQLFVAQSGVVKLHRGVPERVLVRLAVLRLAWPRIRGNAAV